MKKRVCKLSTREPELKTGLMINIGTSARLPTAEMARELHEYPAIHVLSGQQNVRDTYKKQQHHRPMVGRDESR